jgi:hypothetical protein
VCFIRNGEKENVFVIDGCAGSSYDIASSEDGIETASLSLFAGVFMFRTIRKLNARVSQLNLQRIVFFVRVAKMREAHHFVVRFSKPFERFKIS